MTTEQNPQATPAPELPESLINQWRNIMQIMAAETVDEIQYLDAIDKLNREIEAYCKERQSDIDPYFDQTEMGEIFSEINRQYNEKFNEKITIPEKNIKAYLQIYVALYDVALQSNSNEYIAKLDKISQRLIAEMFSKKLDEDQFVLKQAMDSPNYRAVSRYLYFSRQDEIFTKFPGFTEFAKFTESCWENFILSLDELEQDPVVSLHKLKELQFAIDAWASKHPEKASIEEVRSKIIAWLKELQTSIDSQASDELINQRDLKLQQLISALDEKDSKALAAFARKITDESSSDEHVLVVSSDIKEAVNTFVKQQQDFSSRRFSLKRFGIREQLKRLVGGFDKTRGAPVENISDFLLRNPEATKKLLSRRSIGSRNIRKEFCENSELLYKLILNGNLAVLQAVKDADILHSSHLKIPLKISSEEVDRLEALINKRLNLSDDKIKSYLLANPQQAGFFLAKGVFGEKNLFKDKAFLESLIKEAKLPLLREIEKSKILSSKKLKISDDERKKLMKLFNDGITGAEMRNKDPIIKQTVALLDVDHTLMFDNSLNRPLIEALRKNGIKEVCLFTDMTFRAKDVLDRKELVKMLEKEGFKVLGVISAPDYAWGVNKENLEKFKSDFDKSKIDFGGIERARTGEIRARRIAENMPKLENLIRSNSFLKNKLSTYDAAQQAVVGAAFKDVMDGEIPDKEVFAKSDQCKAVLDCALYTERYKDITHPKGILFEQLLLNKPAWLKDAKAFIVIDDNNDVLPSVQKIQEKMQQAHPDKVIPTATILVTGENLEDQQEEYFDSQLKSAMQGLHQEITEKEAAEQFQKYGDEIRQKSLSQPENIQKWIQLIKEELQPVDANYAELFIDKVKEKNSIALPDSDKLQAFINELKGKYQAGSNGQSINIINLHNELCNKDMPFALEAKKYTPVIPDQESLASTPASPIKDNENQQSVHHGR